jgi:hypothetical protein
MMSSDMQGGRILCYCQMQWQADQSFPWCHPGAERVNVPACPCGYRVNEEPESSPIPLRIRGRRLQGVRVRQRERVLAG